MRPRARGDAGLTLVELLVASSLSVLVLVMVGSFMISSFTTQDQVTRTTQATNQAQLTVRQLETALRQASAIRVEYGDSTGSQLLIARVRTGSGVNDWVCEAWYYDADAGAMLHATAPGRDQWPWGASITSWIDLGSGLLDVVDLGSVLGDTLDWLFGGGSSATPWTVMAVGLNDTSGPGGSSRPVFVSEGPASVKIQFAVESAELTPVVIATSVTGRQTFQEDNPACY